MLLAFVNDLVAKLRQGQKPPAGGLNTTALVCGVPRVKKSANVIVVMIGRRVDDTDSAPYHEQVAGVIRRAIAEGEVSPGERLPPAKDLAAVMGVNVNTVLRALRGLRDEDLLDFRRGRGVTVAGTRERGAVVAKAMELVRFARREGYGRDELVAFVESLSS